MIVLGKALISGAESVSLRVTTLAGSSRITARPSSFHAFEGPFFVPNSTTKTDYGPPPRWVTERPQHQPSLMLSLVAAVFFYGDRDV